MRKYSIDGEYGIDSKTIAYYLDIKHDEVYNGLLDFYNKNKESLDYCSFMHIEENNYYSYFVLYPEVLSYLYIKLINEINNSKLNDDTINKSLIATKLLNLIMMIENDK